MLALYSSQAMDTSLLAVMDGDVMSWIVNVAEQLSLLPQSSVAVNVTVTLPVYALHPPVMEPAA